MFLLKKKTLQEPLSVQVDLNRGIKEGVDFKRLFAEINNKQQKGSKPQVFWLVLPRISFPFRVNREVVG